MTVLSPNQFAVLREAATEPPGYSEGIEGSRLPRLGLGFSKASACQSAAKSSYVDRPTRV